MQTGLRPLSFVRAQTKALRPARAQVNLQNWQQITAVITLFPAPVALRAQLFAHAGSMLAIG
jgi:hypothetical protein